MHTQAPWWCTTLWMLCLQKHCDCIYQHLSPQGKLAVNSCISPDIFISPSPHLQHHFNKTQSRDTAQYWHHLITKTPVIHLQQIHGSGVLWKAFKAGEAMRVVTGEKNYTSQQIIKFGPDGFQFQEEQGLPVTGLKCEKQRSEHFHYPRVTETPD